MFIANKNSIVTFLRQIRAVNEIKLVLNEDPLEARNTSDKTKIAD